MAKQAVENKEPKTTKKVVGKFAELISRGGDEILKGRGDRIIASAKSAQTKLILDLEDKVRKAEDELEYMLDVSPDNRYSLKVGEHFDATDFVNEYQAKTVKLVNLRVELEVAVTNGKSLFGK